MLRILLRANFRGPASVGGIAVATLTVWLATASMTPGLRLWPDLVSGLTSATVYTGALAAGVTAFEAGRWSSFSRARSPVSVRPPMIVRLVHAVSIAVPLTFGYALGLGTLAIYSTATNVYGHPYAPWLLAVGAALVIAIGFGYLVGHLGGNYWFVPPAAALAFYTIFVASRSARPSYGVISLFPYVTNIDSIFDEYVTSTMIGQIVLWLSLTTLLIVLAQRGIRRIATLRNIAVIALLVVGALIGGNLVIQSNGQYTIGHNPGDFVCETGGLTVCLNPGYARALPELYSQFRQLNLRTAGTALVANRLEQNLEGVGDDPGKGARSVYLEQFASRQDVELAAYRYVTKYGATPACLRNGIQRQSQSTTEAIESVDAWLSGYAYAVAGLSNVSHFTRLKSMTTHAGNVWFRAHQSEYFACTLRLADLP